MLEIARAGGVRVLGPNCIGLLSIRAVCALSVNAVLEMDADQSQARSPSCRKVGQHDSAGSCRADSAAAPDFPN